MSMRITLTIVAVALLAPFVSAADQPNILLPLIGATTRVSAGEIPLGD